MKATIIFTDHADFDNPEMLKALCYGTSDEKSKDYGKKGFIGNGLVFTKSIFAKTHLPFSPEKIEFYRRLAYGKIPASENRENWQIMAEERKMLSKIYGLDSKEFRKLIDKIYKAGIEISPHCLYWEGVERENAEKLLNLFDKYKSETWIDHGQKYCFNCITAEGSNPQSKFYILDLLHKHNYKYAWAYRDYEFKGDLNILNKNKNPIYFDKKIGLSLFYTIEVKPIDLKFSEVYSKENIDKLIKENGTHIAHVYFFQPIFSKRKKKFHFKGKRFFRFFINIIKYKILRRKFRPRKEISNSVVIKKGDFWEIDPEFNESLRYMAEKQKGGKLRVTTISDFLKHCKIKT